MKSHEINEKNRAKMIDWMVLVFRKLGKKSIQTFMIATQLMDKYFQTKKSNGIIVNKEDLHIVGLVCIFISSKFEDVFPIKMQEIF